MPSAGTHIKPRTTPEPEPVPGARWIALTRGQFALVDEADFEALAMWSWTFAWQGYAFRTAPPGAPATHIRMHRQIMGVSDPAIKVDHRDGNGLNNCRLNLRLATNRQNVRNNRGRKRRLGPYKGVHPSGRPLKPWAAKITVDGKTVNLGRFTEPEQAARAYDAAARKHFGEFARLNLPDEMGDVQ